MVVAVTVARVAVVMAVGGASCSLLLLHLRYRLWPWTGRWHRGGATKAESVLDHATARYRAGERRGVIFRDLVVESLRGFDQDEVTALDIGCGHGFDDDVALQRSIANRVHQFVGIEPDTDIPPPPYFTEMHRSSLEEAAELTPGSVHVAYATFVLEHLNDPEAFLRKIHECLVPGGVFWAFTVDARHPFTVASKLMERLGLKGFYLNTLRGRRGVERYENYPTVYRINSPRQVRRFSGRFFSTECASLLRPGQMDYYLPRFARGPAHLLERVAGFLHMPGAILVIRLNKADAQAESVVEIEPETVAN
jgi:SAM-dependent methyltransferase